MRAPSATTNSRGNTQQIRTRGRSELSEYPASQELLPAYAEADIDTDFTTLQPLTQRTDLVGEGDGLLGVEHGTACQSGVTVNSVNGKQEVRSRRLGHYRRNKTSFASATTTGGAAAPGRGTTYIQI
jgi:hypothetical protein